MKCQKRTDVAYGNPIIKDVELNKQKAMYNYVLRFFNLQFLVLEIVDS